ncbi:cell division protein FtsQ [Nostoc sp. CENA543]|uniref:cell division protein FtsQ/DivIB n=1 Tax=Nostoc sp. CENA543 TaxID=1869241 RepID=UPI000CA1BB77|nr:FtsQ-type POTRA domain-containing protein [Nostoc sp. CENA543]AUS99685.1 cell division protein FtsQ [Nostoc sp. CENA543]
MPDIVSVSQKDLAQRRQKLRRQRRVQILQTIWRTIAISGLAGGLLWVAVQPTWVLKTPKQVLMRSGDQSLSPEAVQTLLPLSYPQSLWRIQPSVIAESLKKQPTIAQATVSRRLFPPGLIIEIEERVPVALAQKTRNQANNQKENTGLIDTKGMWIPLEKYTLMNPNETLPSLKVIGLPEQYAQYWSQLYTYVRQSSVKITEIDCQDPTNIKLKTEIGNVYLGAFSPQLPEQISLLNRIRNLPKKVNPSDIEYIDLTNPESPLVHMIQKKADESANSTNP